MNSVHINTSQNVTIDYNLADIGTRTLAKLLDTLFIIVYFSIFYGIFFGILANSSEAWRVVDGNDGTIGVILMFIISLPVFFYSLWAPYFMQGQTFGKKILKIKIVRDDGLEAGFGTYLVRWLLNVVDFYFIGALFVLVIMAVNQKRQRIADLVAKTVVISTKQTVFVDQTILSHIEEDYQPKFSQVLQLSDRDVQIIKMSIDRARRSGDYSLMTQLRNKIESVIQEYKPEMTDIQYIDTVIRDYQYFSQQ